MNEGQQKFYDFFMERIKDEHREEAKALLMENFKKQDDGTFTKEHMEKNTAQLMTFVKPECIDDFNKAANHMRSTLQ